jgi:hypothetical protein
METSPTRSPRQTIAAQSMLRAGAPIDFSFKDVKSTQELLFEKPVSGRSKKEPISREANVSQHMDTLLEEAAQLPARPAMLNSVAVRVCNNALPSLQDLDKVLNHHFDDPTEIVWLDASCNQLASIEEVILRFPKLQSLNLHANNISRIQEIRKLARLTNLQKLTLHGNPISEIPNYKIYVTAHLTNLRSLDFSTITKVDRDNVNTWLKCHKKKIDVLNVA